MCSDGIQGGKIHLRKKKKEKGLDRVELRSWMENAPRNIPGIVWEQFSRQARDDVSFSLWYKSTEVAGPQQTGSALPRASSTLKEPLTIETTSKDIKRDKRLGEGIPKDSENTFPKPRAGFLLNAHTKFIQDADAYCCRCLPWKPQPGEFSFLSLILSSLKYIKIHILKF